jgi:hypothetical protein
MRGKPVRIQADLVIRSFYLRIRVDAIENDPFLEPIIDSNLWSFYIRICIYARHILRPLSIAYNKVRRK